MILERCRGCNSSELEILLDLGFSPISNDFLESEKEVSALYPLILLVCKDCEFLQLSEVHDREIHFNKIYPYFSRNSKTWVSHCYLSSKALFERFSLNKNDLVIEVASNDGTYIENFLNLGMTVLGIEPSANVADVAIKRNIPTRVEFFSKEMAIRLREEGLLPKLIVGNNVLAHVPNIVDFLSGISILLSADSAAVIEFPHATQMILNNQFDTVYHEHYSYLSLQSLIPILEKVGLEVFDVEEHPLHGGSLRIFLQASGGKRMVETSVERILRFEKQLSPLTPSVRENFQRRQVDVVRDLKNKLNAYKKAGFRVVVFGAAAKGTTLLNVAKVDSSLIDFAVDSSEAKQGRWIPGTGIEIRHPNELHQNPADVILILAWNFAEEIILQIKSSLPVPKFFLIPIPEVIEVFQD